MLGGETWIGGVLELLVTWMQLILDHSIVNNNFWSGREQTRDSEGTFMLSFICTTRISDHQLNSANRSPLFTFSGLLGQNLKSKWQEWTPAEEPSHCSFLLKTLFYSDFFFSSHTLFLSCKQFFLSWQHMWWWLLLTAGFLIPSMQSAHCLSYSQLPFL